MNALTYRNHENGFRKRSPASGSRDLDRMKHKKIKAYEGRGHSYGGFSTTWRSEFEQKRSDYCYQDSGEFGSVTKDMKELIMKNRKFLDSIYALDPTLSYSCLSVQDDVASTELITRNIIDIDNDHDGTNLTLKQIVPTVQNSDLFAPVIIIDSDSDSDDIKNDDHKSNYLESKLQPSPKLLMKDFLDWSSSQNQSSVKRVASIAARPGSGSSRSQSAAKKVASIAAGPGASQPRSQSLANEAPNIAVGPELSNDRGEYVGTDDMDIDESGEMSDTNSDGLGDIWSEMNVALEYSKDATEDAFLDGHEDDGEEECEHSFILKDDIGDVCRICGVIRRGIEKIIEYNFSKGSRSTRTYRYEGRTAREVDQTEIIPDGFKSSVEFAATEINPHPRHMKEMKPHQIDGFNFLLSNLVTDNPGGCIMAHAPGSGKTFMIISFLQSFMAKYPAARPLVVLPKGILTIWKKEFLRWQVEDLPLYDFYSAKADSRLQQLEIIKKWADERSILFLGYKQFSTIICDTEGGEVSAACQNFLLKVPSILILDEGHTPRNQDTDILTSLERVETTRKVVLSGTLYQNHVKEVFNILNLVRPRFLKMERSKVIKKRILSRVEITGRRNLITENDFYELIENTLTKDENQKRKLTVIQDLREMTKQVLHYYKGDNLGELPGLVDFSVFLRLHPKQQSEVQRLKTLGRKFSITSQGSAIYMHPALKTLAKGSDVKDRVDDEKISAILDNYDIREGVKASFYWNLLQLCESTGEKLLVFSQYLLPLKFLEKLSAKEKGYSIGREMFMITGDSDTETRESSMEKFNNSTEARVFFGSIRACGEGISLVGASRIMILDVPLNPSVTRQAIGRAFRPGQVRKVYTYMLIASGSPEEDDHKTCFRKESISKHWFELDHGSGGSHKFEMDKVEVENCGDLFLESARLNENIVGLLKR